MPLRITLVTLLVLLVTVALGATGYVATSQLRDYLIGQQQGELQTQIQSLVTEPARTLQLCSTPYRFAGPTLIACADRTGGRVVQGGDEDPDSLPDVSAITPSTIDSYDDAPFTLGSADGKTSWLLVSEQLTDDTVVVAGIDLSGDQRALGRLILVQLIVGALVLVVLGVAGYLLVRNSLRPLVDVEHTAAAIAAGDLSRRVPAGDDRTEVGRLSQALNGMLTRIEGAFQAQSRSEEQARASETRMRRFVADASHELRTPLTSIRGFAELYRHGAAGGVGGDDPETARMMARIEAEATRMGMLVEDLLQLARLDQQRPVAALPVDLEEVAGDAVHDARAVQPDRTVELVLDDSLTDVPVVLGDEGRLRQVVGNLVTNALTHTPVDARVTVRLSEEPGDPDAVTVSVTDEGPGLSAADAERVFERFYRADASRTRAAGGTGLGLSIVSSLVAAHGGTVTLTTAPGQGATFAVRLPRTGPEGAV
ncbi:histidine kinase [Modestobacter sp. Leaf380]|nr:histidine kinase [Modestobacter sp. Leaf380]